MGLLDYDPCENKKERGKCCRSREVFSQDCSKGVCTRRTRIIRRFCSDWPEKGKRAAAHSESYEQRSLDMSFSICGKVWWPASRVKKPQVPKKAKINSGAEREFNCRPLYAKATQGDGQSDQRNEVKNKEPPKGRRVQRLYCTRCA